MVLKTEPDQPVQPVQPGIENSSSWVMAKNPEE